MSLVLIGYGLATIVGSGINVIFQPIKSLFLLYSMFQLLGYYQNDLILKRTYVFSVLVLLTIPFSVVPLESFKRALTMLLPMIYVAVCCRALFLIYAWDDILIAILKSLRWIYLIPLISFVLFGGNLGETNIYGETIGAFVSNHYGWGSFVYITAHGILIQVKQSKLISIWTLLAGLYFVLLLISGSRSGVLSLSIAFFMWFFSFKGNVIFKFFITLSLVWAILSLLNSPSALSERLTKTQMQYEGISENDENDYYSATALVTDTRSTARAVGNMTFKNNPHLYLTGMGIFQFREALDVYAPWANPMYYSSGVHSSYGELYFGCGLLVFGFFFWNFVLIPFWIYFKYLRTVLLSFVGVVIVIPFFESNLTGGQFLFFPWFIFVFFLLYFKKQLKTSIESEE